MIPQIHNRCSYFRKSSVLMFIEIEHLQKHVAPHFCCELDSATGEIEHLQKHVAPHFCCELDSATGEIGIKEGHHYYSQIEGQMAIGERPCCDFVIHNKMD